MPTFLFSGTPMASRSSHTPCRPYPQALMLTIRSNACFCALFGDHRHETDHLTILLRDERRSDGKQVDLVYGADEEKLRATVAANIA